MRPVHLSLAGLQSYREKQEVDFDRLSDAGVFGIFGPTGSGKSSILDAMTLALYGKVERAPGGTQGIINQMENVCSVSFSFELNGASCSERYRVERQYKRTGDVTASQSLSRLLRLDGGEPVVLADKAKDVDTRIEEILGLSMQDFTRAVVLPQGKFAEFLSLKGVERRHMLERLFHLEQYGDALGAKVNAKLREQDMAVKRAEAEQLGLGDASADALKEARERLNAGEQVFREQRLRLAAAERKAEEARRLWQLIRERSSLEEAGRKLWARQPEMDAVRDKLLLSAQAGRIGHFLAEWESARASLLEAEVKLAAVQKEYDGTHAAYQMRQAVYQEAKRRLDEESEPLGQRLEGLKRSLELHREIRAAEEETVQRALRETSVQKSMEESAAALEKQQQQLHNASALQLELKQRLAALEQPSGRRETLQEALMDLQSLEHEGKQQAEAETECRAAEAGLVPLREEAARLQSQADGHRRGREELAQTGIRLHERLEAALRASQDLLEVCQAGAASELNREQEAYRSSLAANLAGSLSAGEPCPVCGSSHHPAPAASGRKQSDAPPSLAAEWKKLQNTADGHRLGLLQLQAGLAGGTSRLRTEPQAAEMADNQDHAALEAAAAASALPADLHFDDAAAFTAGLGEKKHALEQEVREWSGRQRELESGLQQLQNGLSENGARLSALELALRNAAAKRDLAARRLEELRGAWTAKYPDLVPGQVQENWQKLQSALKEQDELRIRLDKAEPILTAMQEKLNRLREDLFRLERELVQAATERQGREEVLREKRSRLLAELREPLNEEETMDRWTQTGGQLQALKQAEGDGRLLLEQQQEKLHAGSNALAAARQARDSAAAAHERADAHGRRELEAAGFATADAARAAQLDPAEAANLEQQQEKHREEMLEIRSRLQQLEEALAGKAITEEEWTATEAFLVSERLKDEECLRLKAKAERDLEELEAKHGRWLALEKERGAAQTMLSRLQKLQSVFRGNAFVEFMAEEQLAQVSRAASERLGQLTRRRYALETDSTGGFVIRDDANGGLKRPVSTLSGGETFLTSLSLALALSAQIQLNGKFPLEFFFLDEGFGTLDPDLLETVVHALEKLRMEKLTVGVISHVPELKSRLPRRLVVAPSDPSGPGSRISFEIL